jgi:hypothetical protein
VCSIVVIEAVDGVAAAGARQGGKCLGGKSYESEFSCFG